jgi:hypothetical protein
LTLAAGFLVAGLLGAGLWIAVAEACKRGHNWARITGTVLFGITTADSLAGIALPVATAVRIFAAVVWLIGLGAVVLLWRATSTAFFKAPGASPADHGDHAALPGDLPGRRP